MSCGFCVCFFFSPGRYDLWDEEWVLVFKTMSVSTWEACPNSSSVAWQILCKILPRERAIDCEHNGHTGMMTPRLLSLNPHLVSETQLPMSLGPRCSLYWKGFLSRLLPGCIFTQISSSGLLVQGSRFWSPSLKPPSWFPPQALF